MANNGKTINWLVACLVSHLINGVLSTVYGGRTSLHHSIITIHLRFSIKSSSCSFRVIELYSIETSHLAQLVQADQLPNWARPCTWYILLQSFPLHVPAQVSLKCHDCTHLFHFLWQLILYADHLCESIARQDLFKSFSLTLNICSPVLDLPSLGKRLAIYLIYALWIQGTADAGLQKRIQIAGVTQQVKQHLWRTLLLTDCRKGRKKVGWEEGQDRSWKVTGWRRWGV